MFSLPVESSGVSVDGASRHEGVADVLEAPPTPSVLRRRSRCWSPASRAADGRPRPGQGFLDRPDAHLMHTYERSNARNDDNIYISRRVLRNFRDAALRLKTRRVRAYTYDVPSRRVARSAPAASATASAERAAGSAPGCWLTRRRRRRRPRRRSKAAAKRLRRRARRRGEARRSRPRGRRSPWSHARTRPGSRPELLRSISQSATPTTARACSSVTRTATPIPLLRCARSPCCG